MAQKKPTAQRRTERCSSNTVTNGLTFDYITKRKTEDELNEEYGVEWLQAKRVFVSDDQSGIPYGSGIYGYI